ncbi:MAG: glycosyltransferase [Opitutales bacterium]
MKVLVFQDFLRQGGTETQTLFLARSFAQEGVHVEVATFRPGGALYPDLEAAGLPHHILQPFDTRLNTFVPGLGRVLRNVRPDIVLLMGRMANNLGVRIQKIATDSRVVATARTGKAFPPGNRRTFAKADAVVANSRWAAERVAMRGGVPERIHVIHNGFARDWSDPEAVNERSVARTDAGVPEGSCVFLSVAAFRPGKGQERLVQLFAKLPQRLPWQLWMVGDGKRRQPCEVLARKLDLRARVRFWGSQSRPRPYYAGADCAVHASRTESLPNFLVEAQTAALPVVAMRAGGVGETFLNGESGYLHDQDDEAGFLQSVRTLLEDAKRRHQMGEAGAQYARTQFEPKASVRAYLDLFETLLAERR